MPHIRKAYETLSDLHESLLDMRALLAMERDDIAGMNIKGLDDSREKITAMFERINGMNELAAAQIARACEISGAPGRNLSALIAVTPKADRELFAQLQLSVNRLTGEIDNALKINRGLMRDSLSFITSSLQMVTCMLRNSPTYGQQGRFVETLVKPKIICQEA